MRLPLERIKKLRRVNVFCSIVTSSVPFWILDPLTKLGTGFQLWIIG